jgi:hypothetical protein
VFPSSVGTPMGARNLSRHFKSLLRRAGLPLPRPPAHVRHAPLEAGRPRQVRSELLGHADISLALNVYSHVLPDQIPRWWEVDIDVRGPVDAGASSPVSDMTGAAPKDEVATSVPAAQGDELTSSPGPRRLDTRLVFTAYLVLTNVLLMGFIGFLLIQALT